MTSLSCKFPNKSQTIKPQNDDSVCDICVFGYSCKLFRDDEKAMEMDQGKHLISWMGSEHIKIDRYDVRGYFSDLSQYEVGGYEQLTAEDKKIEELCDTERYRALFHNEEEQEMYREEELKRMQQSFHTEKEYGQVPYQYDSSNSVTEMLNYTQVNKGLDKPFYLNPLMDIPPNIVLPSSENMGQIIEKTADSVAKHGRQLEIVIKTRQAKNEKFDFLNSNSDLNPYYEYILVLIKNGQYRPKIKQNEPVDSMSSISTNQYTPFSYSVESAPTIPQVAYKKQETCPYNMLVKKINNFQKSKEMFNQSQVEPEAHDSNRSLCENNSDISKKNEDIVNDNRSNSRPISSEYIKTVNKHHIVSVQNKPLPVLPQQQIDESETNKYCNSKNDTFKEPTKPPLLNSPTKVIVNNDPKQNKNDLPELISSNIKDFKDNKPSCEQVVLDECIQDKSIEKNNSRPITEEKVEIEKKVEPQKKLKQQKKVEEEKRTENSTKKVAKGKDPRVSFFIKKVENPSKLLQMSALPAEDSSEDEEKDENESQSSILSSNNKNIDQSVCHDSIPTNSDIDKPDPVIIPNYKQKQLERKKRAKALVDILKTSGSHKLISKLTHLSDSCGVSIDSSSDLETNFSKSLFCEAEKVHCQSVEGPAPKKAKLKNKTRDN